MNKCYSCGGEINVIKGKPYKYDECGLEVELHGINQYECIKCEETYVSIPKINELHRLIGKEICQNKKALLTANEIKFLRKEMHLKSKELAKVLGVTPQQVSRWENNKNQIGETQDRLLRLFYINYASEKAELILCHDVIGMFSRLERKRKIIEKETKIDLSSADWMGGQIEFCAP